jgi:prepilin-type N-terminal cleavage/methylation domain-containing protein
MSSPFRSHRASTRKAWPRGDRSGAAAGFSLAEVLVALAIAAMMAAMLTRFVAGTRANAAKVTELTEMAALGETLLARIASSQSLTPGRTDGRRDTFAWRIDITPVSFTARARRMNEETAATPSGDARERANGLADSPPENAGKRASRAGVNWVSYRVAVIVQARSGQSYAVDTIRIGPGATDDR